MSPTLAILHYLQHLAILTGRQSDQVLQEQLGIGMSQYRILKVLQSNPSVQQKHIASLLGQTEASISRQVKLMQSKAMLVAKINPQNRRQHLTKLLPKGERLLEASVKVLEQYHKPIVDKLNGRDQAQLVKLLNQFHQQLCNVDEVEGVSHLGGEEVII
jgi:DNA-binding MarR family transcriptional regulator